MHFYKALFLGRAPGVQVWVVPVWILFAAVLLASGVACGAGDTSPGTMEQVRGMIVEVVPRNITEIETLRVRDSEGKEWVFVTEGDVGISPSHVKEHQLFGQPVLVSYVKKGNDLVALDVED